MPMITLGRLEAALVRWRDLPPRWDAWRDDGPYCPAVHVQAGTWEFIASWLPPRKVRRAWQRRQVAQTLRKARQWKAARAKAAAEAKARLEAAKARIVAKGLYKVRTPRAVASNGRWFDRLGRLQRLTSSAGSEALRTRS